MTDAAVDDGLRHHGLTLTGRVQPASNATFVGRIGDVEVVYKPIAGERPLWDFPDGTLAHREVAAYLVSEALGWRIAPATWLRDGPHGPGMTQRWVEVDPTQRPVDVVPAGELPDATLGVVDGLGAHDEKVTLVHEDSAALRRMAVFDILVNNADRKGGHVLPTPEGHRYGIDHGLTFHVEPKLRTVLWGWVGQPLGDAERAATQLLLQTLDAGLADELRSWLSADEVQALRARADDLLASDTFPAPHGAMPAIPWPPF